MKTLEYTQLINKLPALLKADNNNYTVTYAIEESVYNGSTVYLNYTFDTNNIEYNSLVSAIIRQKYSQDDIEAIILNYLDKGVSEEYTQLQDWRLNAKSKAKEVLEIYERIH